MKQILIFIGLKIAEILGVCGILGILYGIGIVMTDVLQWLPVAEDESRYWRVASGVYGLLLLSLIYLICYYGIYTAIKVNWKWAGRLTKWNQ